MEELHKTAPSIKALFEVFDDDKSGFLNADELKQLLGQLQSPSPSEVQINEIIAQVNADGDGQISLIELVEVLGFKPEIDQLRAVFSMVDEDGSGEADIDELTKIMEASNTPNAREEAQKMLKTAGKEGGTINCEEFVSLMVFQSPPNKKPIFEPQELSEESIQHLKQIFNELDKDGSGYISKKELKVIFKKEHGRDPSRGELKAMLKQTDLDSDGKISMAEFLVMMGLSSEIKKCWEIFTKYDTDGSGKLERTELVEVMKSIGIKHPKREAKSLIKSFGPKKKSLTFENFVTAMFR